MRSWTHLERQRGGFGFLGGPGETQIEADRRHDRRPHRPARGRAGTGARPAACTASGGSRRRIRIVALVGYTNAGKSTLFNRLTGADVLAEDLLFATLDPTMRAHQPAAWRARSILSDTVGFISDLPTQLSRPSARRWRK